MLDFQKVQKSDIYDNLKNKNDYFTLNIDNNPIKNNIEKNIDINQNEENECINIISKEYEQDNYFVYNKNIRSNNSNNLISEKKQNNNFSSQNINKMSKSFNLYKNKVISTVSNKNVFDEPEICTNSKEEEPNRLNIVQPIVIEQKEEKEKINEEKEYSLIMTCISLLLLIKFPPVGILFFISWMIKIHKKKMIIIIVIVIILMILFSTLIYIFYWKKQKF